MAQYVEIDSRDLLSLVTTLQYAAARVKDSDKVLFKVIEEVLDRVCAHMDNDRNGCREAREISAALEFLHRRGG